METTLFNDDTLRDDQFDVDVDFEVDVVAVLPPRLTYESAASFIGFGT